MNFTPKKKFLVHTLPYLEGWDQSGILGRKVKGILFQAPRTNFFSKSLIVLVTKTKN